MLWVKRGLLIATLVFAALTAWMAWEMGRVPPPSDAVLPNGFETPILAAEFPRNASDLEAVLSRENEDLWAHIYDVQLFDEFFPWTYVGLMTFFWASVLVSLAIQNSAPRRNLILFLPVLVFAAYSIISSDLRENEQINLAMMALWQEPPMDTQMLDRIARSIAQRSWQKWLLIAAVIAMTATALAMSRNRVFAVLAAIPVVVTLYARFLNPSGPAIELMAQAITVFFLAIPLMAVYFLVQSFRRTESPNESPRQVES